MTSFTEDPSSGPITQLLAQISAGDRQAENLLMPQIYDELPRIASRFMRRERQNHTLQPTALANEAYIRLVGGRHTAWQSRAHFFAVAAKLMRQILVDHARSHGAAKRGGSHRPITLSDPLLGSENPTVDILVVHELIEQLASLDPKQGQILELHFFGGLSLEEIALVLNVSVRTAKRDWSMARAWLHGHLVNES